MWWVWKQLCRRLKKNVYIYEVNIKLVKKTVSNYLKTIKKKHKLNFFKDKNSFGVKPKKYKTIYII